jgi:SpoVK/Ycf46/Vps4 family AAA+-type ATPase
MVTSESASILIEGHGFDVLTMPAPSARVRRALWARHAHGLADSDLDRLAARYQLSGTQIATAARAAGNAGKEDVDRFAAAARRQSARALDSLATRVPARATWDDLVLPDPAINGLRELCDRVVHRHTVLKQWGLDQRTNGRLGVNALFAGPSGTGKTMAAQVIAHELGLELFAIDLSGVVSKYIGETEKNLDAIFRASEGTDAVLLFDEADALFGKRSEVRDSHDRYANLEVSYLLQRMEAHDGVAILATNLRQNLDEAFLRRLAFTIRFPFPEEEERRRIWSMVWPTTVPLETDIDVNLLASRYKFSGGNIRNVAVGAAFLAASAGRSVSMADVLAAVDREYDKLGGGSASGSSLRVVATSG